MKEATEVGAERGMLFVVVVTLDVEPLEWTLCGDGPPSVVSRAVTLPLALVLTRLEDANEEEGEGLELCSSVLPLPF